MTSSLPKRIACAALLTVCALWLAAAPAGASERARTPTEAFALNVFVKNYLYKGRQALVSGTWRANCKRIRKAKEPTARCRTSWDSAGAHWVARGSFRGAVRIGPFPYRSFRWRFRVTERRESGRVRHHLWNGRGVNAPA